VYPRMESRFRTHDEIEPSGKTAILGEPRLSAERMAAYVRRRNPNAPDVAELYLKIGDKYGVRGDLAFCQAIYETKAWAAVYEGPYWRPLLAEVWASPPADGGHEALIEAQIQRLYGFATEADKPLPAGRGWLDVRFRVLERRDWRGSARCWEDLNGRWIAPGRRYGQDIVAIWRSMGEWRMTGKSEAKENSQAKASRPGGTADAGEAGGAAQAAGREQAAPGDGPAGTAGAGPALAIARDVAFVRRVKPGPDASAWAGEDLAWLKDEGLLPEPTPHPERKVTWAEAARLLRLWTRRLADEDGG